MQDDFDGFSVHLFQDEDGDWLAHLVELPAISAFAGTPAAALGELAKAWEAARESYREHGEPVPVAPSRKEYSGQFNVRIDKRLHRRLAMESGARGDQPERPGGGETGPGDRFIHAGQQRDSLKVPTPGRRQAGGYQSKPEEKKMFSPL